MLTIEKLRGMSPDRIFASGRAELMDYWDANKTMQVDWVACRGGIHDWAIYAILSSEKWSNERIASFGDKVRNREEIKKLVPCDEGAMKMYRD